MQHSLSDTKDALKRAYFLPTTSGLQNKDGWIAGRAGVILKTNDGGSTWGNAITASPHRIADPVNTGRFEELNDIYFTDSMHGYLVGHHGVWSSADGGASWSQLTLKDGSGTALTGSALSELELYAIDVVTFGGVETRLVVGEPGVVFRSDSNNPDFKVVWDIRNQCSLIAPSTRAAGLLFPGGCSSPGTPNGVFEPWDVEISRGSPTCSSPCKPLAVMVGGIGTNCGLILTSTDFGTTWENEQHECDVSGASCTLAGGYFPTPPVSLAGTAPNVYYLSGYRSIYGTAVFPTDNTAVSVGYNGQVVVRDASVSPAVWRDYSRFTTQLFSSIPKADYCLYPLLGVSCSGGSSTSGIAVAVGEGEQVRVGMNTSPPFHYELEHRPWRVHSLSFNSDTSGWQCGQNQYVAKTIDGGLTWDPETSGGSVDLAVSPLYSIAVNTPTGSNPVAGVTVGTVDNGSTSLHPGKAKILRRRVQSGITSWVEPTTFPSKSGEYLTAGKALIDVSWVSGTTFVACGFGGLCLLSTDGGDHWQVLVNDEVSVTSLYAINYTGVAFASATLGVLVGTDTSTGEAVAYSVDLSSPRWTEILREPNTLLADVQIVDDTAFAVGEQTSGGSRVGVAWESAISGSEFDSFSPMSAQPSATACVVGEDVGMLPVLTRIVALSGPELFAMGECGRAFHYTTSAGWVEVKSETDAHILGMSGTPSGYVYAVGGRINNQGASNIVRWNP